MQGKRDYTISAAVVGGIFAIIAAVVGVLLTQHTKPTVTPDPVVSTQPPILTPAPTVALTPTVPPSPAIEQIDEELRQGMRQQHNVRRMEIIENELKFSVSPRGIFGFAQESFLEDTSNLKLHRDFTYRGLYFEIHKMSDGKGHLVGFASPDIAVKLQREDCPSNFPITIYSCKWSGASNIISIPLSKIKSGYSGRDIKPDNNISVRALDVTLK